MKTLGVIIIAAISAAVLSFVADVVSMLLGVIHAPFWLFAVTFICLFICFCLFITMTVDKINKK